MPEPVLYTDLAFIAEEAVRRAEENDHFLQFARRQDSAELDRLAHALNDSVSASVDCTQCGNCCQTLMINVTQEEVSELAVYLREPETAVREQYIEESLAGNCFINAIPCHFLKERKCAIYDHRFLECREFPHLHKNGFRERLLGTLLHYGRCPIIYNVIEQVKQRTGFLTEQPVISPLD